MQLFFEATRMLILLLMLQRVRVMPEATTHIMASTSLCKNGSPRLALQHDLMGIAQDSLPSTMMMTWQRLSTNSLQHSVWEGTESLSDLKNSLDAACMKLRQSPGSSSTLPCNGVSPVTHAMIIRTHYQSGTASDVALIVRFLIHAHIGAA